MNPVVFNSVTPSQITTNKISQSPEDFLLFGQDSGTSLCTSLCLQIPSLAVYQHPIFIALAKWFICAGRRSEEKLFTTGKLCKEILDSHCLLIFFISTKKKMKSWTHPKSLCPWVTPGTKKWLCKFLFFLINVFFFSLFIYISFTNWISSIKKHGVGIFSRKLAVFFEVQLWNILIELEYQIFLISNLKF